MTANARDIIGPSIWFALVCVCETTISFIVSIIVFTLGVPLNAGDYVRLNLFVTGCVALATALNATLHDFHTHSYQRRLEALASTDELTGLLNRRFFQRAAVEECRRMRRTGETAAVAMMDLDFFKEVNDLYGHAIGDRVLENVARVAHAELRGPFDKPGRWGGEEFVVLLTNVTPEEAQLVCERLRRRIERSVVETGEHRVKVTASFGICMLPSGSDPSASIDLADRALSVSKQSRRNCVQLSPSLPSPETLIDKDRLPEPKPGVSEFDDDGASHPAQAVANR